MSRVLFVAGGLMQLSVSFLFLCFFVTIKYLLNFLRNLG